MADYTLSRSRLAGLQLSPVAATCCLAFTLETTDHHSDHITVDTVSGGFAGTKRRTNGAEEFSSPKPEDVAIDHNDVQVG